MEQAARIDERDDAATGLYAFNEVEVEEALVAVATDPCRGRDGGPRSDELSPEDCRSSAICRISRLSPSIPTAESICR